MLLAHNVGVMQASIVGREDSGIRTTLCIVKLSEPYQAPLACMFQPPPTGLKGAQRPARASSPGQGSPASWGPGAPPQQASANARRLLEFNIAAFSAFCSGNCKVCALHTLAARSAVPGPAVWTDGSWLVVQNLGPHPDLVHQNRSFKNVPGVS